MRPKNISKIIKILEKYFSYKERTTLNKMRKRPNPFKVLITCLLSLRTRDETTELISKSLFKVADTPQKLVRIDIKKLKKIIFSTGHYNKKAQTLKHVSKELIKRFNGKVPNNKFDLLSIKGVGPKTANVVLNFAFGQEVIPVDVHVHVIVNRLGWVSTRSPEKTETKLEKVLPKKYWKEINGILVLFGREVCITISPFCSKCPIRKDCKRIGVKKSR